MSARDTGKNKAVEVCIGEFHRPWTTAATVAHHRVKANSQPPGTNFLKIFWKGKLTPQKFPVE
jgi:hypothetical protein